MMSPNVQTAVDWFVAKIKDSFYDNLHNVTVYGPAVTAIYDKSEHQIHHLIVVQRRSVDSLLALAKHSKDATRLSIGPPLIVTQTALRQSRDVFPLEWLDISQFHHTVFGKAVLTDFQPQPSHVRLQCERELRSIDILLQRGILASDGKARRINRLEREASDLLIRVLRGISWLTGDRQPLLPEAVCKRCEEVIGSALPGCREAIHVNGRHDVETVKLLLAEIGGLSAWVDDQTTVDP